MTHWISDLVGRNVRMIREDMGWSRYQLTRHAGLGPNHARSIEEGRHSIQVSTLAKIAEALDIEPHLLLDPDMEKKVFETWEDD